MAEVAIDRERWQRIEEILDGVLDLPPAEHARFLDEACGDDELRAEVEALMAADAQTEGCLDPPAGEVAADLLGEYAGDLLDDLEPGEAPAAEPDLEGRKLGPYRVVDRIGAGGMGVVYEAFDTRLGRSVALKLLPQAAGWSAELKERFLREARTASALDHPNICTVHDIGTADDGRAFIVMPRYQGETLKQKLERGPLPIEQARDLAAQVARGLERAHGAGITHRDVKPANVMVTGDGIAKILDFGIARIAGDSGLTRTGLSPGTPAYMSPEQARGEQADARSDVWSLGVMLYEMWSGRRPFSADHPQAQIFAILNSDPAPLTSTRPELPRDLARIVARALAKDPDERYQTVAEMRADLEAGTAPSASPVRRRRRRVWTAGLAAAGLVTAGGWWALSHLGIAGTGADAAIETAAEPAAPVTEPASLAVLFFTKQAGGEDIDWLRQGIADMLVTDLSQSPGLDLLSTGRLYQILEELGALERQTPSFELIQQVAEKAGVGAVVRGSYAQVGEVLSIVFTVEDAATGDLIASRRVEGSGRQSLFSLVDQLSATVRDSLEIARPEEAPATVEAVTTSSLDAWRYYIEGVALGYQGKLAQALVPLEMAVAVDPTFALALAALGQTHRDLRHEAEALRYTRRAIEHADRLPLDQRFLVESAFYSNEWMTYDRALAALGEAARLYPDLAGFRINRALLLIYLERFGEALELYDQVIATGTAFAPAYLAAANAHAATGDFEAGYRLLSDFAASQTESWLGPLGLGFHLTQWGRLEEAAAQLRRAGEMRPGQLHVHYNLWRVEVLREDFGAAGQQTAAMATIDDPHARWLGAVAEAWLQLYRGRSDAALDELERAIGLRQGPDAQTALTRCLEAELLLARGEPAAALVEAERAQSEGRRHWPELQGMFLAALAQEALGRPAAADRLSADLRQRQKGRPNRVEERLTLHLEGRLALARGDAGGAVETLERAAALLPPRGFKLHRNRLPDHVPLWSALGRAELATGRPERAEAWFSKVAASGSEHIEFPVLWVRSLFELGKIHHDGGRPEEARRFFSRFVALRWLYGDLDREQAEEAMAALGEDS